MGSCDLCSSVHQLAEDFDESRARHLIPAINAHLRDIRLLLAKSKLLSRDVHYRITPSNERTNRVLSVTSVDLAPIDDVCQRFNDHVEGFWESPEGTVHVELRRRLACVAVFLRSRLGAPPSVPARIPGFSLDQLNYTELRNAGRKYIKIARKLGGLGSLFSLPLDIPHSTYERYLNIDDDVLFGHLGSLNLEVKSYTSFVKRLILYQLQDDSLTSSYYNLTVDYADCIPDEDYLMLLLHALGGADVPEALLKDCRSQQRRWNTSGEIKKVTATDFGLPPELISIVSDDETLLQATKSPSIRKSFLEDGTVAWSLSSEATAKLSKALHAQSINDMGVLALKVVCFTCPPCYEGNTTWSPELKMAVWAVVDKLTNSVKVPPSLRSEALEAVLYFAERDAVAMRQAAVARAKTFLRRSMPYTLHATVALFESILSRVDGNITQSESVISDFYYRGPRPVTRRDHALRGRLHISEIENKIKSWNEDDDIPSFIYKWAAEQPLSALDTEVTFRLQSTAARFFQSVGDFPAARASLEHIISLDGTKPIRLNSRRLLAGRLSDVYCEMQQYDKVMEVLQPELDLIQDSDRPRRGFRRLMLAWVEAKIGMGDLTAAEALLEETGKADPLILDDVYNQQLHMRRLFAAARVAHMRSDLEEAVSRWQYALEEVEKLRTLKSKNGFTASVAYLSLAHAQLGTGDLDGARHSWSAGMKILGSEKCEFWIPVAPTLWLGRIAAEVYKSQGWSFRMMLPGGRGDLIFG